MPSSADATMGAFGETHTSGSVTTGKSPTIDG